jgi:hypothetical protein
VSLNVAVDGTCCFLGRLGNFNFHVWQPILFFNDKSACCEACAHEICVETPDGRVLGYVKQKLASLRAKIY